MCKRPKKPHLKPNPNAFDTSGSYSSEASFNLSFSSASFKSSYFLLSIGYIPQYTNGFISLYPDRASSAGLFFKVIVSPTLTSLMLFIEAVKKPTSPWSSYTK